MTYTFTDEQHEALARIADFDHVFVVDEHGDVHEARDLNGTRRGGAAGLWAPDAIDVDPNATELDGWALPLSDLSGQHGYRGPWLHDSEVIPGGVAEAVLAMPGYWVAIYAQHTPECDGDDCAHMDSSCAAAETTIEGWTMAHRPFPA